MNRKLQLLRPIPQKKAPVQNTGRLGHPAFNWIPHRLILNHSKDLVRRLISKRRIWQEKLDDDESDLNPTPKNKPTRLTRSYAVADLASEAAETEDDLQLSNGEYEPHNQPESQGQAGDTDLSDNEPPTPKKKQKTHKVPIREAIHANRKEQEQKKADDKVSWLI